MIKSKRKWKQKLRLVKLVTLTFCSKSLVFGVTVTDYCTYGRLPGMVRALSSYNRYNEVTYITGECLLCLERTVLRFCAAFPISDFCSVFLVSCITSEETGDTWLSTNLLWMTWKFVVCLLLPLVSLFHLSLAFIAS